MIWRIPFQFCPSCNWTRILIFKYSLVSSALEFQFFALYPSFKWLQTHLSVRVEYRPALWTTFAILNSGPLKLHGLKVWKLGWLRIAWSLSLSLSLSNPLTFDTNRWNRNTATRFSRLLSILDFCPRPTFSTIQLSNDNSSLLFPFKRSFVRVYW